MTFPDKQPQSWGRYPSVKSSQVVPVYWRDELPNLASTNQSILPFGYGRSYGDSCLNEGGISVDVSHLRNFISFDQETGLIKCEAGVSLADVLAIAVPRGWFLPVSPGTKFVSVGGAIANDVHGKNHHVAGTFGRHVTRFELMRSNGDHLICSPEQNKELFSATIGGLGLTGMILWAEFRLKKIVNPYIDMESIRFESLDEFFEISADSDQGYDYTVAWADFLVGGSALCRGKFSRGNHNLDPELAKKPLKQKKLPLSVPIDLPSFVINTYTVKAFNEAYYHIQLPKYVKKVGSYEPFFYPLDAIHNWNRIYGKRGFFQYQFVVPFDNGRDALHKIIHNIQQAGEGSFLTVLKQFGYLQSPGMLSFPRPGVTLAIDFSNRGARTQEFLRKLDPIIEDNGGVLYPAKDSRMSPESFQKYYPRWKEFEQYIDPKFSSSFWRRVTQGAESHIPMYI